MVKDLNAFLEKSRQLAEESSAALSRGDYDAAVRFRQEADIAWREAMRLGRRMFCRPELSKTSSMRERAVSAIQQLDVPVSSKLIAAYCQAMNGVPFDVRGIASIRRDEFRSWSKAARRDIYIVPALEGPWFLPGRGHLTLSSWPVSQRVVGPLSPRVNHLKICLHLAERVDSVPLGSEASDRIVKLLVAHVRSVWGAMQHPWEKDLAVHTGRVREAVLAELTLLQSDEETWRHQEAERALRTLSVSQLMWGSKVPAMVAEGGG
jgi:hypothetical protein